MASKRWPPAWREPSSPLLPLRADRITVWRIPLEVAPALLSRCAGILGKDERQRADRFHFSRDQRRFVASHYALRMILSAYLGMPANELRFTSGPYGKPTLDVDTQAPVVHFSLSHAHEMALIAVAAGAVGIDLEYHDATAVYDDFITSFCSPRELPAAVGHPERALIYWTCKEAYLKGLGTGCALSPATLEVFPSPMDVARTGIAGDTEWSVCPFAPASAYHAAVAARGCDWNAEYVDWPVSWYPGARGCPLSA